MNTEQLTWLAICIYFEAMKGTVEEQIAIGHVVLNRVVNENKPIKYIVQNQILSSDVQIPIKDYDAFIRASESALECIKERQEGKTLYGANYYFEEYLGMPEWTKHIIYVCKIEHRTFYKE